MSFQVLYLKGYQFFKLVDNDNNPIKPSYMNSRLWLKHFSYSNSLCAKATRAIINHVSIGEYRLKFFLREEFKCLCSLYPVK